MPTHDNEPIGDRIGFLSREDTGLLFSIYNLLGTEFTVKDIERVIAPDMRVKTRIRKLRLYGYVEPSGRAKYHTFNWKLTSKIIKRIELTQSCCLNA